MKKLVLFLFLCWSPYLIGQDADESLKLDGGPISSQFDYLWTSSNKYENYKVVKMSKLEKFKRNIIDTLKGNYEAISGLTTKKEALNQQISALNTEIDSLNADLSLAVSNSNAFEILGMKTSKSSFKAMFFLIIGVLLGLTVLFFLRMRSKTQVAALDNNRYNILESEFEDFKKRAREKEQVLARQLQNEINKKG